MTAPLIDIYDRTYLNPQINTVVNDYTGRTYPMQQNIPVLLHEYYLNGLNNQYRKLYNWLGSSYDLTEKVIGKLLHGNALTAVRKETMAKLEIKNGDRVLCVSIGTGTELTCLPEHVDVKTLQITGVDISIGMLQKCRKNLEKQGVDAQLINCCAEALPFEDNYFDVVFHVGGINMFTDKAQAVKEMIRVAKPGTKILVADETEQLIKQQFENNPAMRKQMKEWRNLIKVPVDVIPGEMEDITLDTYWKNRFYSITFRKPVV